MQSSEKPESAVPDVVSSVTRVAASIVGDIYKDVAQPSARRIGLSLETLVKVALSPIDVVEWGFEKSREWLKRTIEQRLAQTPSEFVVQPTTSIAYSALRHIAISGDTPELRGIYAELLLKAMDSRLSNSVHPAYFSIVEQLAAQEALVLVGLHELKNDVLFTEDLTPYSSYDKNRKPSVEAQFHSFCVTVLSSETDQSHVWLANLCRLNLLSLQTYPEAVFRPEEGNRRGIFPAQVDNHEHRFLTFTDLGKAFIAACAPRESIDAQ